VILGKEISRQLSNKITKLDLIKISKNKLKAVENDH
jgi:hypothetical protein